MVSLVGGVCKEQGRIRRGMVNHDYYAFHIHKDELQSLILVKTHFVKFGSFLYFASLVCVIVIRVAAQKIKAILTCHCLVLP